MGLISRSRSARVNVLPSDTAYLALKSIPLSVKRTTEWPQRRSRLFKVTDFESR